ncbi:hypothetical protein FO440_18345 [Mucilaginibacter corticis]|uniref:Uncharacterized protein n=1 Tax=Mucilaginibacter corticis TaxID=2597670 RepID=A0A556MIL2_9SPHI|nr:hypothetical protein [Mucilaginibacter corticis]TSJ39699.1 hypothetical protein FO440_18345 [Mucilaginibacter corticis]
MEIKQRNPLDWYRLTESASSILNGLVALAGRESFLESKKLNPDQKRLNELKALGDEAIKELRNTENFKSLEKMEAIISNYSLILQDEKKKL